MRKINKGIVFSNDIDRILKGNNALDFNYEKEGLIIPSDSFIEKLRSDFESDTKKVFDGEVSIVDTNEMLANMIEALLDVYRKYPHRIFG